MKSYIAIDLKSFYASVECVARGLDPLQTNLVVADTARTEKTICLAVTPSLKAYGIGGRARLFEVTQRLREVNSKRMASLPDRHFSGKSHQATELQRDPTLEVDFIAATPRMAHYIEVSRRIYKIYLHYVAEEDIHVYSIDEVFINATDYLTLYKKTASEFARTIINDVLIQTGITATAGIGTNMYLAKVAMDIEAKHIPADNDGVRIAQLDEFSYRQRLWSHRPLTDFWRIGAGIAARLASIGVETMGQLARRSIDDEESLYRLFGINAELLIDHAWGWEPCTIAHIKRYKPSTHSISSGQVLSEPYTIEKARVVLTEMADALALDLVEKQLVTNHLSLGIGYDASSLKHGQGKASYHGLLQTDRYGRSVPQRAQGTVRLESPTASTKLISKALTELFDRIANPILLIRYLNVAAGDVVPIDRSVAKLQGIQLDLFTDPMQVESQMAQEREYLEKEQRMQQALLKIKHKYGKNAILKGTSFEKGATARSRNQQIGGHKS